MKKFCVMTNFYGTSMYQNLPTGNFDEVEVTETIKHNLLKSISDTNDYHNHGYLIECDLEYPPKIHGKNKHFPFVRRKKQSQKKVFQIISRKLVE